MKTKSWDSATRNDRISGSGITTFGFPPNLCNLAWASPMVRDTESLPGSTRSGACPSPQTGFALYTLPPLVRIRFCSSSSQGLWSRERGTTVSPLSEERRALLSPTLATKQVSSTGRGEGKIPTKSVMRAQEPEVSGVPESALERNSVSARSKPFFMARSTFSGKNLLPTICTRAVIYRPHTKWCRLSRKKSAQPLPPCPSYNPKNEHRGHCLPTTCAGFTKFSIIATLSSL